MMSQELIDAIKEDDKVNAIKEFLEWAGVKKVTDRVTIDEQRGRFSVELNELFLGAGTGGVEVIIDNKKGENGVFGGIGKTASWFFGLFPKSTVHPDDLVLHNPDGGFFIDIGTAGEIRYRQNGVIKSLINPEPIEIVELIGKNPSVVMKVETGGSVAQMSVVDDETQRLVASMEWVKSTGSFAFNLLDKNNGVIKSTLEIKTDGNAYMNGKKILKDGDIPALPTADGDYKLNISAGVATWVTV